jgi:hypothetical protein
MSRSCGSCRTFGLVFQSPLGRMAGFEGLVRNLGGGTVVMLSRRNGRHVGTAGALEAKRKRCQGVYFGRSLKIKETTKKKSLSIKVLSARVNIDQKMMVEKNRRWRKKTSECRKWRSWHVFCLQNKNYFLRRRRTRWTELCVRINSTI